MELKNIADIRIGLVITRKRAREDVEIKKKYPLLTLKNIELDGSFNEEKFEMFNSIEILSEEYFTKEGDILMRLSEPHTVVFIDETKENLLIPSYFAIIKVKGRKFLNEYIAWYLNSTEVKREINKIQTGGTVVLININDIRELKIKDMSIAKQETIINFMRLSEQELNLTKKLINEKEKYYNAINMKFLKEEE